MEININCDLGESSDLHSTENDQLLLKIVNSASIACGYHAGDEDTMKKTVEISRKNGVSVGAHPSFDCRIQLRRCARITDFIHQILHTLLDKRHYSCAVGVTSSRDHHS